MLKYFFSSMNYKQNTNKPNEATNEKQNPKNDDKF